MMLSRVLPWVTLEAAAASFPETIYDKCFSAASSFGVKVN